MPKRLTIIGSGPSGLTAAIYAARANMEPLLFEGFQKGGMPGGQLMITSEVENFPGFPEGILGPQLMSNMREQAIKHGTSVLMEDIEEVDLNTYPFTLKSISGETYSTDSLIIATGATARRLPLDSEKRLWGKGISACAVCDGALPAFRNKELAVIGGGDTALEEALHLTQFASKVYIIHRRDELRASKVMQKRVLTHPKIQILWNKVVEEFIGETQLSSLILRDTATSETSELSVVGAFEAIGHVPNTGFLNGQLEVDELGYIKTVPGSTKTSIEGVFASGDVQDHQFRQAVTAAGSGCMAATEAERWLQERAGL
ncbi:thioredoxin-disulfide reductase [Chitinispirillales bacterium ANBcel5]|uniref:thioredoxin-disulfide reductase n=1 Tax=Cellulosispirillum alkaliphilum TaxID=3039283 RepID=UPI002A532C41|nr:thioredoxin-disulfide reductase [Chitinispirillales bacterium ANBcel5]